MSNSLCYIIIIQTLVQSIVWYYGKVLFYTCKCFYVLLLYTTMVLQASNPSAIGTAQVGYSINRNNCIPTMTVDSSSNSQVVSIMNVEQLVGANVKACVQYRNMECTSSSINSSEQSKDIATTIHFVPAYDHMNCSEFFLL